MDAVLFILLIAVVVAGITTMWYLSSARGKRETGRLVPAPTRSGSRFEAVAEAPSVARTMPVGAPPPPASPLFDLDLDRELRGAEPPSDAPPPGAEPPPVEIRWANRFDARSGTLDEVSRLRLIGDLGVVAKEWCVPLLAQAYEEERRPGHRQAALIALTACHSRAAAATFRNALTSTDPSERAIAADGLADLEPPSRPTARRTVERH
jgi:hypothetical protein